MGADYGGATALGIGGYLPNQTDPLAEIGITARAPQRPRARLFCIRCELVHIWPSSFGTSCGSQEDQAMPRIPEWLTVDLMIIAAAMVFIGAGVVIAP